MKTGEEIPIDLIIEILSRLSAKSVGRFRCVWKLWYFILHRSDFTEVFLTRSLSRPRFLFALNQLSRWRFFSLPQLQSTVNDKSSSQVASDLHIKFRQNKDKGIDQTYRLRFSCCYASGLICFSDVVITCTLVTAARKLISRSQRLQPVICNPLTGKYLILPTDKTYKPYAYFLGFDSINKQFKVLSINFDTSKQYHKILTLGTGKLEWRVIQCPFTHKPVNDGICINGVIYYLATKDGSSDYLIVCFDVRSEEFKFISAKYFCSSHIVLINYGGRLGGINWKYVYDGVSRTPDLQMCILEDGEEWSKYVYTLPDDKIFNHKEVVTVGVTTSGEIVFSQKHRSCNKPFYVLYFSPERNTLHSVEVEGLGMNSGEVYAFENHVEDLSAKLLKSSQSLKITKKKRKRQGGHPSLKKKRSRQSS